MTGQEPSVAENIFLDDVRNDESAHSVSLPRYASADLLNLRHDPRPWQQHSEELLSPEAIEISNPNDLRILDAGLVVTNGGKTVTEIALNRPRMVLGRHDGCDIMHSTAATSAATRICS